MSIARMAPTLLSLALFSLSTVAQAETIRLSAAGQGGNSVERDQRYDDSTEQKRFQVRFQLREAKLEKQGAYSQLDLAGVPLTNDLGMPRLPFHAVTLPAGVEAVNVTASLGTPVALPVGTLFPAQMEQCRCPQLDQRENAFVDKVSEYRSPDSYYRLDSLGDYRGQPLTRVMLFPHRYDPASGYLYLYPDAKFEVTFRFGKFGEERPGYDYLVISPRAYIDTLEPWIAHKRSQGLSFHVQAYEEMGTTTAAGIRDWIHAEYNRAHFRYSLIVGGENLIPQMRVETTTDRQTPSDLPYYTMGDANDVVPEVLAGRVVADNTAVLARVLRKWMAYERGEGTSAGWNRAVGIASNEGSNPSDADYVTAIQQKLTSAFGASSVYFYQDNADSNPATFNGALNAGAMWVTYLGHGSGTDWPSFGSSYGLAGIAAMRNNSAVKPIWIDVACLNGILRPANAGSHLMGDADPDGAPIGTAAYLGGTVLVSWHPPAIFARGVAFKMAEMVSPVLGEAIQAGQKYLTENNSNVNDIASNQRWYHLQGDPSMRLRFK